MAHEAYPGHHTERACKEKLLYRDRSRLETSVMITTAPEVDITEGLATNALEVAVGDDGFGPLLRVVDDLGVHADPAVAEVVHVEESRLFTAAANVARMQHEDGITENEAES